MTADDPIAVFDALYAKHADPWRTRSLWYERRKRALLLACLPRERYGSAYEAGCGTGHVSVALAARCDALLASDASDEALAVAAPLLADRHHVVLEKHRLPQDWPPRAFELIVLGELLYFLDVDQCVEVARLARDSAGSSGLIVACDWRGIIEGRGHTGDAVHRAFAAALALPTVFDYRDEDFVLTGWSNEPRSVAQRDGLR